MENLELKNGIKIRVEENGKDGNVVGNVKVPRIIVEGSSFDSFLIGLVERRVNEVVEGLKFSVNEDLNRIGCLEELLAFTSNLASQIEDLLRKNENFGGIILPWKDIEERIKELSVKLRSLRGEGKYKVKDNEEGNSETDKKGSLGSLIGKFRESIINIFGVLKDGINEGIGYKINLINLERQVEDIDKHIQDIRNGLRKLYSNAPEVIADFYNRFLTLEIAIIYLQGLNDLFENEKEDKHRKKYLAQVGLWLESLKERKAVLKSLLEVYLENLNQIPTMLTQLTTSLLAFREAIRVSSEVGKMQGIVRNSQEIVSVMDSISRSLRLRAIEASGEILKESKESLEIQNRELEAYRLALGKFFEEADGHVNEIMGLLEEHKRRVEELDKLVEEYRNNSRKKVI